MLRFCVIGRLGGRYDRGGRLAGEEIDQRLAVLDLHLECGLRRLLPQLQRARLSPLLILGLPLCARTLRTPRPILVEFRIEPVIGLAELRGRFAPLSEESIDLILQLISLVEQLRAIRVEFVLFFFDLVKLCLDAIVAVGKGLRLGIIELLLEIVDRRAIRVNGI